MAFEPWLPVAVLCAGVGVAALTARVALNVICREQERRLARENQALEQCWSVLAEVPGEVLDAPLRRIVGRVMLRRLGRTARFSSDHPYLYIQREAINHFITGSARDAPGSLRRGRRTRADRAHHMQALRALKDLIDESAAAGLLSHDERARAASAIGRELDTLEFLAARHASVEPDALRRMTRALGQGSVPVFGGPQSRRLFPTQ